MCRKELGLAIVRPAGAGLPASGMGLSLKRTGTRR